MGYLKITSSDPRIAARAVPLPRPGDVALRARRSSPPSNVKPLMPRADQIALANIAQRFAPGAGAPPVPANEDQRTDNRPQPQKQSSPPRPPAQQVKAPQARTQHPQTPQAQASPQPQGQPQAAQPQAPRVAPAPASGPQIMPTVRGMRALIAALIAVALLPSALFGAMIWSGAVRMNSPAAGIKTDAKTWTAAPASVTGALAANKPQAEPEKKPIAEAKAEPNPAESKPATDSEPVAEPKPAAETQTPPLSQEAERSAAVADAPQPRPVKTVTLPAAAEGTPAQPGVAASEAAPAPQEEPAITGAIAMVEDEAAEVDLPYDTNLIGVVSWDRDREPLLGATGVEEVLTRPDDAPPPPDHLMMRAPDANDDDKAWITAPQYVNLRKGPTSSAEVIKVVAKGTKLEVKGRKRGWVLVANPQTSDSGWIYTGSKARRAKRGSDSDADEGSSWLGSLLGR
jgi:hypothetical protein